MNKLLVTLLLLVCPGLVLADSASSLSFAPPASDYSVVFLGNLFGVVDGVLSGTGSQIMGSMFAVFNAAVLALGGYNYYVYPFGIDYEYCPRRANAWTKVVLYLDSHSLYSRFGFIDSQGFWLLFDANFCHVGCCSRCWGSR